MAKKFVVLVVEDDSVAQAIAQATLEPHAEVLIAGSYRGALKFIRERSDLTHVTLDGRVPMFDGESLRNGDTTHGLVFELELSHPNIKIFTASSDDELNAELSDLGCTRSNKQTASSLVVQDILFQKTS